MISEEPKKILLTNSYAVNNGDMALVIALYDELKSRGYQVQIATFYYQFLKSKYPDLPLVRELIDYSFLFGGTAVKRFFLKLNFAFNRRYRSHDVFIASPGGYMNSYYGLKRCLLPLVQAKKSGRKTAVYSQSVGPLNERDIKLLSRFSRFIDVILVRDDYSKDCISGVDCFSKVYQTKDAAFLIPPRPSKAKVKNNRVAVSVREWSHDSRNMGAFHNMVQTFCEKVLAEGYEIEFISTCQGVPKYRDDSEVAKVISDLIVKKNPGYSQRISVDAKYHTFQELVELLNTRYCFTIGTRLHMCILSLLNGTPAFNISYEVKGRECYKYLGLDSYSVDFNEDLPAANVKFAEFLQNYSSIRTRLPEILSPVHEESKLSMDNFLKEMHI